MSINLFYGIVDNTICGRHNSLKYVPLHYIIFPFQNETLIYTTWTYERWALNMYEYVYNI